ncbi:uncharacterized protein LOC114312542 isoform X2 [Camellia sinensis]|uniref:uncharacterized protein LOC114312542 isoform X1 n=1 Tax=Camellia sinensis TaxID=4442 RepID=UPI001035F0CB|nr:uncharacterized protein LOC114312542 isoform X1 [Camellia sinensis]XP_028114581.1 uncharacterized protein LOC114312542 isoform X2 [Camellia sinensis]
MPPKRLAQSSLQPSHEAIVVPNGDLHDNVDTQHSQPLDVDMEAPREAAPQSSVVPTRHPRGLTRGLKVQAMVQKDGKLKVTIPQEYRALVGDHASQLVSKIGVEVRTHLPDFSIRRWKHVNEEVTAPMFQRLTDQFDMEGDSTNVSKAVATKCGRSLSSYTYRLQKKYLNLKSAKGEEYARSHPPPECDLEKWKNLIDKKWNDANWLKQSNANIDNRNQLKTKHRCGSKSLPVRVHEATIANGGQLPELPCVYKSTHFNDVTKQWISPECEENYDNMIKIQAEHCSRPGVVPITPEELSVKVLKPRSGYVKGLGLRRSFSVRTTSASTDSDYVRRLQMEIQEQKEQIQSQKEEIQSQKEEIQSQKEEIQSQKEEIQSHKEEITAQKHEIQVQREEIQAQNKEIGKMNGSIDEHFEITSSIMEFLKKQGFKGQFRG